MHPIEFKFTKAEDSPGYLLGQMHLLWQRKLKKILDPLDLTQTQFTILAGLAWLSKSSDAVTQVDIANQGNMDRMMVSKVLKTLLTKKLITRQEHKTDTRAKVISLTKKGGELLQQALVAVESADIAFFSVLDTELPNFNKNMVKLIEENKI